MFPAVWPGALGIRHLKYHNPPSLSDWFTACLPDTHMHIDIYTHNQTESGVCFFYSPSNPSLSQSCHFTCVSFSFNLLPIHFTHQPLQSAPLSNPFFLAVFPQLHPISLSTFPPPQTVSLPSLFTISILVWWLSGWWYRLSLVGVALSVRCAVVVMIWAISRYTGDVFKGERERGVEYIDRAEVVGSSLSAIGAGRQ